MIPEFGHFALILALCLTLTQAVLPLLGTWCKQSHWIAVAKPAALGQCAFLLFAFACLTYAFISNDFSVAYVAENSNTQLPLPYRMAAVWGAHEGSLLLWLTILGLWTAAVALCSKQLPREFTALVLAVLGLVSSGFLLFLLLTSSPFKRLLPDIPQQGIDLNPLLQDPGLVSHPPMLYMGYVGFSVAFAFAIAALLSGRLDAAWARWSRPWTLAAWCFLTLGITLGSWWAYRELGWGGWWFWDPVENASLLPWLAGTALIHSLIVTEKRGAFKSWTALLAITTFSLSLIGTFLVRSGVLVSVHAFANDPARGAFLLQLLAVVIGAALLLYAVRAPTLRSTNYFALLSRESLLLSNNILLMIAMATILLGTLYPLILDSFGLDKISVGAPYFNTVFIPLMTPLLIFMGIGPLCYWREMDYGHLLKNAVYPFVVAVVLCCIALLISARAFTAEVALGLFLAFWILLATLLSVWLQIRARGGLRQLPRRHWGMVFAHLGIAVCVVGITLSTHYQSERDVRMQPGDHVSVGPYDFQFLGVDNLLGPNYSGASANFLITENQQFIALLHPQKRIYNAQQIAMTKTAIDANLVRDLYVALGDPLPNGAWGIRIYYKPFVRWIWWGGLLMVVGGLLAIKRKDISTSPNKVLPLQPEH